MILILRVKCLFLRSPWKKQQYLKRMFNIFSVPNIACKLFLLIMLFKFSIFCVKMWDSMEFKEVSNLLYCFYFIMFIHNFGERIKISRQLHKKWSKSLMNMSMFNRLNFVLHLIFIIPNNFCAAIKLDLVHWAYLALEFLEKHQFLK